MKKVGFLLSLVIWVSSLVLASIPRVTVDVMPRVASEGDSIRVRCKVPKHADNRSLTMGIADVQSTRYALEGSGAPVSYELLVKHVLCGETSAYCIVQENTGKIHRDIAPIIVTCNLGGIE